MSEDKEATAREMLRRARGRARLKALADTPVVKSREEMELDRLRVYLKDWRGHQAAGYTPGGGALVMSTGYRSKGSIEASEWLAQSDGWAMSIIDASVDDLVEIKPEGALMRCALRVRWLNEGLAPGGEIRIRVFRSKRVESMSLEDCDRLADRAERELLPIVKRRGLPL